MGDETKSFVKMLQEVYSKFGFLNLEVKFSDRPDVRAGDDSTWDIAEDALRRAAEEAGLKVTLNSGEGAFYGPKLEFVLRDSLNRQWQLGTLQADFILPKRLDAFYIDPDGNKQ